MFLFQSDPARIRRLLRREETEMSRDARKRLQWFSYCLDHDGNVSLTCRYFGIARSTFLRWANRFDPSDPETLEEHSRRPKRFRQPETPESTVALIKMLRERDPHVSRVEIVRELREQHHVEISEASVGRVIRRYALFFGTTPSHARKRREIEPLPLAAQEVADQGSEKGSEGLSFAPTAVLLLAIAITSVFGGLAMPRHAYAADSDDFSVNDSISASQTDSTSGDFQIDNSSMSWEQSTAESSDFVSGEEDSDGDSGGTGGGSGGSSGGGDGGSSGGGGGRRDTQEDIAEDENGAATDTPDGSVTTRPAAHPARAGTRIPGVIDSPFASAIRIDLSPLGLRSRTGIGPYDYAAVLPNFFDLRDTPSVAYGSRIAPDSTADLRAITEQYASSVRRDIALLAANVVTYLTIAAGYVVIRTQHLVLVSEAALLGALRAGKHAVPAQLRTGAPRARTRKGKNAGRRHVSWKRSILSILVFFGMIAASTALIPVVRANVTVPQKIIYNGQLKNRQGQAITTAHTMRFSFWTDSDAVSADILGDGSIDTTRPNYADWQEVHPVTPNSSGYFSLNLGSGTALPALSSLTPTQLMNLHLQVEVKQAGQANTAFQIMDVNTSSVIDRTPVRSVPFALNADLLDQRDTGTGSGNIAVLGSGGVFDTAHIPGGTNSGSFILDRDNTESSAVKLQFGQTLNKVLSYDISASRFDFNDDVRIQGDLTVTGVINGIDLDTLVGAAETSALKVSTGAGLNVNVAEGSYRLNGDVTDFAGQGNIAVTDNATNYLFFGSGGIKVNTVGFPTDESAIPLATIVTSGGDITTVSDRRVLHSDDRERSVAERYSAGFEHVVFQADAASNVGQMSEQHDSINLKNYYQWTSTMGTLQDYDVVVRVPLSEDFSGWLDNPLQVQYRSTSADSANSKIDITVFDTNGSPVTLSGSTTSLASTSWATTQIEFTGTPTWTPATEFLIKFKMSAKSDFQIHLGGFLMRFRELLTD